MNWKLTLLLAVSIVVTALSSQEAPLDINVLLKRTPGKSKAQERSPKQNRTPSASPGGASSSSSTPKSGTPDAKTTISRSNNPNERVFIAGYVGTGSPDTSLASPKNRSPTTSNSPKKPFEYKLSPPSGFDYQNWLTNQKSIEQYINQYSPKRARPREEIIQKALDTKENARQMRKVADASREVATSVSENRLATSRPGMQAAMISHKHAKAAIDAADEHVTAQSEAMVASINTSQHNNAIPLSQAASRQAARSRSRHAHMIASNTEYGARVAKELALNKPDDSPTRAAAFKGAVDMRKVAESKAHEYYVHRDQYKQTKQAFPEGSSSSDEEWPLRDTPRPKRG